MMLHLQTGVALATTLFKRASVGHAAIFRRVAEDAQDGSQAELPPWAWFVLVADLIVLLPLFIVVCLPTF